MSIYIFLKLFIQIKKKSYFSRFFNLSKIINHSNIVSCFGYVNVSPGRYLLVSEYSQINLYEHCQTMLNNNQNTFT